MLDPPPGHMGRTTGGLLSLDTDTRTLEQAGFQVLEIDADNADSRTWDDQVIRAQLEAFIATRATPVAEARSAGRARP